MFLDEWFEKDYYKQLPLGYHVQSSYQPGQFFWTHLLYTVENLELWRAVLDPNEPTKTIATDFRITAAGRDAFKRSLPLAVPHLETNEEFIVTRAKKRPVLLIQPQAADMAVDNKGYKGKVQRKKCLVAPIYGLADPKTGTPDFNPAFVDRVRKMEFPQGITLVAWNPADLPVSRPGRTERPADLWVRCVSNSSPSRVSRLRRCNRCTCPKSSVCGQANHRISGATMSST